MVLESLGSAIILLLVFWLGLSVGSFLNVVIYRLPREGLSIVWPHRSFCPNCTTQLPWYDNIPLFSFLRLKGKCRFCGTSISYRYPLVELLCGLLAVSVLATEGFTPRFFFYYYFLVVLVAIAFIDLELMVIPDLLVWPTYILGFIISLITPDPLLPGYFLWDKFIALGWNPRFISFFGSLLGFLLGFFSLFLLAKAYLFWRGQKGIGEGDPPLLGLLGVYLGWISVFPILLLATFVALLGVCFLLFSGKATSTDKNIGFQPIPFGPFLALSAVMWYFYGQIIINWYLSLMLPR
ncbi:MAG: prepilin peptidase [Deltaproteobacteria bacterium]|jgi:leader peptidase (prepilin peptidase)/N-methyltransferase|nr:prepilin peptidase [Deltaproteobacteria bacterium]